MDLVTAGEFFSNLRSGALHDIEFAHTTTTDITTAFSFPTAQLTSVNLSDDGGIRVFNLAYTLIGTDDEYSILFKNART
jgi:hypothetical protein